MVEISTGGNKKKMIPLSWGGPVDPSVLLHLSVGFAGVVVMLVGVYCTVVIAIPYVALAMTGGAVALAAVALESPNAEIRFGKRLTIIKAGNPPPVRPPPNPSEIHKAS